MQEMTWRPLKLLLNSSTYCHTKNYSMDVPMWRLLTHDNALHLASCLRSKLFLESEPEFFQDLEKKPNIMLSLKNNAEKDSTDLLVISVYTTSAPKAQTLTDLAQMSVTSRTGGRSYLWHLPYQNTEVFRSETQCCTPTFAFQASRSVTLGNA